MHQCELAFAVDGFVGVCIDAAPVSFRNHDGPTIRGDDAVVLLIDHGDVLVTVASGDYNADAIIR